MNQEFILNRKVVFYSTTGAAKLREIGGGGDKNGIKSISCISARKGSNQ